MLPDGDVCGGIEISKFDLSSELVFYVDASALCALSNTVTNSSQIAFSIGANSILGRNMWTVRLLFVVSHICNLICISLPDVISLSGSTTTTTALRGNHFLDILSSAVQ